MLHQARLTTETWHEFPDDFVDVADRLKTKAPR